MRKTWITLNRYDSEARYSLIVSLHVPETDVELLTPVKSIVDALIAVRSKFRPETMVHLNPALNSFASLTGSASPRI
ncbi:hypothetical protein O3Q57_000385 [Salmonella enterica]|nr:hypothetical protein [Salmonella enterica]